MVKPTQHLEPTPLYFEIIEHAPRAKAGSKGLAIATGNLSEELVREMNEIRDVLTPHMNRKHFTDPKGTYVSG